MPREHYVSYSNMQDILNGIEQKINGLGSQLTGIYTWQSNTGYKTGDVVIANGSLFICSLTHTSSTSFASDIANWVLFFADISPWMADTYYVAQACVIAKDSLYQCKNAHTSGTTFDTTEEGEWKLIAGAGQGTVTIENWASNIDYVVDQPVVYQDKIYRCNTAHKSGSTFDTTKFDVLSVETGGIPFWEQNKEYVVNNVVIYDDSFWKCKIGHTSTTAFDISKWSIMYANIKDWQDSTDYIIGQVVVNNNKLYRCKTAHTSDTTFSATEQTNWDSIGGGTTIEDWVSGKSYAINDMAIYQNSLYKCTTANSDVIFDSTNWVEIGSTNVYANRTVLWEGHSYTAGDVLTLSRNFKDFDYIVCYAMSGNYTAADVGVWDTVVIRPAKEYWARIGNIDDSNTTVANARKYAWLKFTNTTVNVDDVKGLNTNWYLGRIEGIKFTTGGNGSIAKIPDWASGSPYTDGDFVIYNARLYKCLTANSDVAWDSAKWQEIGGSTLSAKKTVLWTGQWYTQNSIITLSDIYSKYDYLIIQVQYASNNTATAELWDEGTYFFDPALGNMVDIRTADSGFNNPTNWTQYKNGNRYCSIVFTGNTAKLVGSTNLSAPTASAGGYYVARITGFEFVNTAGSVTDFVGATSTMGGSHGLVPKPIPGDEEKFLCGDGTWKEGGSTSIDTWQPNTEYKQDDLLVYDNVVYTVTVDFTSGATFSDTNLAQYIAGEMEGTDGTNDGKRGIVPAPKTTDLFSFLCADGTWKPAGASSAGLIVDKVLLWDGWLVSDVSASSPESLLDDFRNYDYLEFVCGWSDATTSPGTPNNYTALDSVIIETFGGTITNPCGTFEYMSATNTSNIQRLGFDLDFSANVSFNGGIKRFTGTNTTTNQHMGLWKIYGIKLLNPFNYSTTESAIGTWIDGKTLYQRTFTGNSGNTVENVISNIAGVDKVIDIEGYLIDISNNFIPLLYCSTSSTGDYIYVYVNSSGDLIIKPGASPYVNCDVAITVKYTKV